MIELDLRSLVLGFAAATLVLAALVVHARAWRADRDALHVRGDIPEPPAIGRPGRWMRGVALALLALALAAPSRPVMLGPDTAGRAIAIALDVSMSMRAADVAPTRLDEARRQLSAAMRDATGVRLALIAFAAEPTLVCPPTTDLTAFDDLLQATTEEAAIAGLSHAASAIERATRALGSGGGDIVLVSDGEFPAEDRARIVEAVQAARRANARITTIGVGTPAGALVPVRGAGAGAGTDATPSKLDTAMLAWLAEAGGGQYIELRPGEALDLVMVLERQRMSRASTPRQLYPFGPVSLFGYPLALALLLLAIDAVRGASSRTPARARVQPATSAPSNITRAARALMLLAGTLSLPALAHAQAHVAAIREGNAAFAAGDPNAAAAAYRRALAAEPSSSIARANLGTALARMQQFEGAIEELAAAVETLTDPQQKAQAQFNLGTVLARAGRFDDALAAYRASLRVRDDEATRFNYALVWRWRQAQGDGPAPEEPTDPQRLEELRDKARALDVPIVRKPADQSRTGPDR